MAVITASPVRETLTASTEQVLTVGQPCVS